MWRELYTADGKIGVDVVCFADIRGMVGYGSVGSCEVVERTLGSTV